MANATKSAPVTKPATKPVDQPSAKPGTEDAKAKKEKVVRVAYPGLIDTEGKEVKLKEIPTDLDKKLHKPLTRKNFEDESLWFEIKAREFDAAAAKMRKLGEESKKLGNVKDRGKAKKLLAMQKRMKELMEQLSAAGVDTAALLGSEEVETATK